MPSKADPLRVSQTVKKMMENDEDYNKKGNHGGKNDDVELNSKDQELIFSRDQDQDKSPNKMLETITDNTTPGIETTEGLVPNEMPKF